MAGNIDIRVTGINELYVSWQGIKGNTFNVYRSSSPTSGFDMLASGINIPAFIDGTVNLYDDGAHYYYRIDGILSGAVVQTSDIETVLYNRPDGVAMKVMYEADTVLRVMNNPLVYILIRKRGSDNCPNCWNPITKRVKFADCPQCFGTGNIAGYYAPIPCRMSMDVSQLTNASNIFDGDQISLTPINAWTGSKPLLNPEDVVVDVLDRRFVIQNVIPRTRSQYVIRQILQMVPLDKGHPAYKMVVDRSVKLK